MRCLLLLSVFLATSEIAQAGTGRSLTHTWTSPMNLSVVLVKFQDEPPSANRPNNYEDHDTPHGWTKTATGSWIPGQDAYTLDDFKRLFGQSGTFTGTTVTVAKGREALPEVFGSLADYFTHVSGGQLQLQVTVLNDGMDEAQYSDYPKWIELPQTKWYYAEMDGAFWKDAYKTTVDAGYTLPSGDTIANRKQNKIVFVYAGAEIADDRQLHPRVRTETTTDHFSTNIRDYGFMYVAAERRGGGNPDSHDTDAFSDVGIHAHEMGHLLGLQHFTSPFSIDNPYTTQTLSSGNKYGGDWTLMESASHGPAVWHLESGATTAWVRPSGTCPMPPSVVNRKRLGWTDDEVTISSSVQDRTIEPGPDKYYRIITMDHASHPSDIYLELREAKGFGRYVSWHRFDDLLGMLVLEETCSEATVHHRVSASIA